MSWRWTLITCVPAPSIVPLGATAVHLALPAVQADPGGGLALQQWVVSAHAPALGSLILVGGSPSDRDVAGPVGDQGVDQGARGREAAVAAGGWRAR